MTVAAINLEVRVLELLVSRLCHDLISPVGAINNGVELMEEMGEDMAGEAIGLIAQSGRQAAGRLQCFRVAYGAAGGQAGMGWKEARAMAEGWLTGGKVKLDWAISQGDWPADPPAGAVKLLLNAVMLADEALSYGGVVTVDSASGAFLVKAKGRAADLGADRLAALAGRAALADLSPKTVHAYAAGIFSRHYRLPLDLRSVDPGELHLRISL